MTIRILIGVLVVLGFEIAVAKTCFISTQTIEQAISEREIK